jgi:hypothetical protein
MVKAQVLHQPQLRAPPQHLRRYLLFVHYQVLSLADHGLQFGQGPHLVQPNLLIREQLVKSRRGLQRQGVVCCQPRAPGVVSLARQPHAQQHVADVVPHRDRDHARAAAHARRNVRLPFASTASGSSSPGIVRNSMDRIGARPSRARALTQ